MAAPGPLVDQQAQVAAERRDRNLRPVGGPQALDPTFAGTPMVS